MSKQTGNLNVQMETIKKKKNKMDILALKSYHQNERLTGWTQYQIPDGKQVSESLV